MNVAFYDLKYGTFHEHQVAPKATPDDVRSLVFQVQIEALQKGDDMGDIFLVAWDGKRKGYFSVFVLEEADQSKLNEQLLDSIREKAFRLSAK